VGSLFQLLGAAAGPVCMAPLWAALAARVWLIAAVLLFYLGIAMFVALFSKDNGRADRARAIFSELLSIFRWRRPR
jgi:predicted permease